jgi:predicted PurR-regulated permease PerM
MATLSQSFRNSKFATWLKTRKKNPDWARVDEPDNILPSFTIMIFGLILAVIWAMVAYAFMTGQIESAIAHILAAQKTDLTFDQLYAAFTSVVILLISIFVLFALSLFRVADNDDIVEMISDLDENVQERIVELESNVTERLERIEREGVTFSEVELAQLEERINGVAQQIESPK